MSASIRPGFRRLRTFAFDPGLATSLDTADVNAVTLSVPWEPLQPGPVGEYLELVDYDPSSAVFYPGVDLERPDLLAQDGMAPQESDPAFHQQMAYAVAMLTIHNFERALGRRALWAARYRRLNPKSDESGVDGRRIREEYVPRLRIYPHALREANAYYDPDKKAVLFGYFRASLVEPGNNLPGGMIFTGLSHDVIAHEMTHALLDGLHRRFIENTNPDVLAFHEAFADIVALFQHFSLPGVLFQQVETTRGRLEQENFLGKLAQQFGEAIGQRAALRDAIGGVDATGTWRRHKPDPLAYRTTREPHARGAILVAAVFDAFLAIYARRTADLYRIAGLSRTGPLPERLPIDLAKRLATEAEKTAGHVLRICIRALDYVPPVDVTFSDYLRAIVTADYDVVASDDFGYRIAMIDAFRRWGIYPASVRSLNEQAVRWQSVEEGTVDQPTAIRLSEFMTENETKVLRWNLREPRQSIFEQNQQLRRRLHAWLHDSSVPEAMLRFMGLTLSPDAVQSIERSRRTGRPRIEVHSIRPARRVGPDGEVLNDLVVELTQWRKAYLDPGVQEQADAKRTRRPADFLFRGGCTLLVDVERDQVRYCIGKDVLSTGRLERTRRFFGGAEEGVGLAATYFGRTLRSRNPFRMLHEGQ